MPKIQTTMQEVKKKFSQHVLGPDSVTGEYF